ncbi:MAG TPA: S8 family serine peptidase, partial [Flavisolibacter sp.]|nr:S8 family serine peptidase [Flavisolibacter sp.]
MDTLRPQDSVSLSISLTGPIPAALQAKGRLLQIYQPGRVIAVRMRKDDLDTLLRQQAFQFIQNLREPKEELTTGAVDYSLNQVGYVHRAYPEIQGSSIMASVKERLFDTLDIDLKGRVFKTGLEINQQTSHASLMATIIGGAGNSSELARGAAPASELTSSSFTNLFPDKDSVFQAYHITVQNHSYGTVPENFYGNEAMAYDLQAHNLPVLLHIFSAGNSGNLTSATGTYAGIPEVSNLSGNFKQAKNILTVSAIDSVGTVMPLSSKGPAYDGRVKPELTAYGEDGSSGAAALVSGAAVLVQDSYKKMRTGRQPTSALVKAALINSADDIGAGEVDYATGYGKLNAFRAVETVLQERFGEDSLQQDEMRSFALTVPSGIARLKITLTWTDLPAQVNAAKALVNDLDALLTKDLSGASWQPWVLSAYPVKDSLLLPARRRTDTLNTVEQITLD